jgi:hypothetical protein
VKTAVALVILAWVSTLMLLPAVTLAGDADAHWPQFRGPRATGVAPLADPPIMWSESKNVKWEKQLGTMNKRMSFGEGVPRPSTATGS